jgi:GNAT superfamily N-acetyltransferase
LRDGSWVTVRRVQAADEPALRSFLTDLCGEAQRLRFFTGGPDVDFAAHLGAAADHSHFGLVAHDELGVLVGHATYVRLDSERAEVAVEVSDHLHGHGLGTILIELLAAKAEEVGITHFLADVLCENRPMLDVFREGFGGHVVDRQGPEEKVEFRTCDWRLAHSLRAGDPHHGDPEPRDSIRRGG